MYIIDEENYAQIMREEIIPQLEQRAQNGMLLLSDGAQLRYFRYAAENARGSIVICHGFTESAEKYFELAWYFLSWGYNVILYDQRGHGHSHRETEETEVTHIGKFALYASDLAEVGEIERRKIGELPLFLYAHSMGGAAGALCLSGFPSLFNAAVLNAPMIEADTGNVPRIAVRILASLACFFGQAKKRAYTCGHFNPDEDVSASACDSKARFEFYLGRRREDKNLQNCAYSYGWLLQSMKITRILTAKKTGKKITAPVLLFSAENDRFVTRRGQERFMANVKQGEDVFIRGTKHEIYYSENEILLPYLERIKEFYGKQE